MRQHVSEPVIRDLRKKPLRNRLDLDEPRSQLGHRQHFRPAPRHTGNARHLAQNLAVCPVPTTPHNRNRTDAQRFQLGEAFLVLKYID